ncbi:MAG: hypothetical protein JNJ46_31330 [Myxococcales bacterium]|nr:hypothetical protein [Myxococcales bacterium]
MRIETVRLRALRRSLQGAPLDCGDTEAKRRDTRESLTLPDAGLSMSDSEVMEGPQWKERQALDQARLDFYELPVKRRLVVLALHAQRVAAAVAAQQQESDAQRRIQQATAERQQALDAAKRARSEAERLVAEELARLLGIEQQLSVMQQGFDTRRAERQAARDVLLGWQRRAREARQGTSDDADKTYDSLRQTLRDARAALAIALDQVDSGRSQIPDLGPDPFAKWTSDISTDAVRKQRDVLEQSTKKLTDWERRDREERAADLMNAIDTLNRERLELLDYLSSSKRGAVTGFTGAGLDQARSELRHLLLVLRYHRHVSSRWLGSLQKPDIGLRSALWHILAVLVPWALVGGLYLWWRRRAPQALAHIEARVEQADREARLSKPSVVLQMVRFGIAIHVPVQRIALFLFLTWLIPDGSRALLEVQLLLVIAGWILTGGLVVGAINAVFEIESTTRADTGNASLRLRSLRLAGRVVVAFALILLIGDRLVGQGTVYRWIFSTCWVAAIPIFLVLIRWWRETVFQRVERVRRRSPLQRWVLSHRRGWASFAAATVAGVHLFGTGAVRLLQGWAARFGSVRRIHAYFFRRELDKLGAERAATTLDPLPADLFEQLGPDRVSTEWIEPLPQPVVADVIQRIQNRQGGIFAVVGARGAGKTTLLGHLGQQGRAALHVGCAESRGLDALRTRMLTLAGLAPTTSLECFGEWADDAEHGVSVVLLDDLQTHVATAMGGLEHFDQLMALAQRRSKHAVWVLAIDEFIWPFLRRARGTQPIFDDVIALAPWSEERIGQLLDQRTADTGLTATFEDLLEELPSNADELDRQDALRARQVAYYRLLWDHANGNPGIALHLWRIALRLDRDGIGHVQRLQTPPAAQLDLLPDPALFTLRAILQRSQAAATDVVLATQLRASDVADTLRYALARGYLVEQDGLVRVSWTWLSTVVRFLERRHLLVVR